MLPTPSTDHVAFDRIYEPAEDSYLLLDTLSSETEKAFLGSRFNAESENGNADKSTCPLVVEIGTGSGVVLSFVHAHADIIFGRSDILTLGVDVNRFACKATAQTIHVTEQDQAKEFKSHGFYLGNVLGDLTTPLHLREVDVLVFNPPYVPTPSLPSIPGEELVAREKTSFEDDSKLLELSYAGGVDGMETTDRLLEQLPEALSGRGVGYVLLCAQNRPEVVKVRVRSWGNGKDWRCETVGMSGKKGGWEKLQIIRIWRSVSECGLESNEERDTRK